ncbi:hypothetical protein FKG94_02230 [Exilibacterium tricleocarpae]|uniref:Insecticide toxin TcdB middle/N-terminal domain-containing protein n=1 Tax=Exilibacterium tricleocarpae TaxID=2591008 RepID=A0A545U880_9GAMM|nr:FG-GAP-like repeat-containing protein [Exilibacterium tricleocarpae]TQV85682.1 hypothetical protein FKG94_02230 [Exilibacterium tricleocarpae]
MNRSGLGVAFFLVFSCGFDTVSASQTGGDAGVAVAVSTEAGDTAAATVPSNADTPDSETVAVPAETVAAPADGQPSPASVAVADKEAATASTVGVSEVDGTVSSDAANAGEISYDTHAFNGEYTTTIDIDLPKYRDLTPALALKYESNSRNGQLGLGWHIGGLSTITRASPGRGAPRYDDTDIFLFNGSVIDIIPCTPDMSSPGCQNGGTHTTKVESYQRLTLDSEANKWTLTFKDGTRFIYTRQLRDLSNPTGFPPNTPETTFRWALSAMLDTHGNQVTYWYWCDGAGGIFPTSSTPQKDCYIKKIFYNRASVNFYWETRPDPIFRATGRGMVKTRYRLKTIDVRVGDERRNSYSLSYTQSAGSKKSLLSRVTTHGRDAVVDSDGIVTDPGTTLAPIEMRYAEETVDPVTRVADSVRWCAGNFSSGGDFNGDGRTDYRCGTRIGLSNGDGSFEFMDDGSWCGGEQLSLGDFNGDGQTDFQCHRRRDGKNWIKESSHGLGFFVREGEKWCTEPNIFSLGDFNGDGKTDYHCKRARDGQTWVQFSNGDGTFTLAMGPETCKRGTLSFGDFNGDGKTDYLCRQGQENGIRLSRGDGTFVAVGGINYCLGSTEYRLSLGDFNGDGATDLQCHNILKGDNSVALSKGGGSFAIVAGPRFCKGTPGADNFSLGDFNGDYLTDLQCHDRRSGTTAIAFSKGDGTFTARTGSVFCKENRVNTFSLGDFNGDGRTDYQCHNTDNGSNFVRLTDPNQHLKLVEVTNHFGGTTRVEYTPSSAWFNLFNPRIVQTVTAISKDDGRNRSDSVRRTEYTYWVGVEDKKARLFMGFARVTAYLPCLQGESVCPYERATYRLDLATRGQIADISRNNGDSTFTRSLSYQYDVDLTRVPHTALVTGRTETVGHNREYKRIGIEKTFDDFGNVVSKTLLGDVTLEGDERTVRTTYVPNTDDYIVNLPARVETFDGLADGGSKVAEVRYLYDNAATWSSAPTVGNRTEEQHWLNTENRFVSSRAQYDAEGNIINAYDAVGARTEFIYDELDRQFVVETRKPLYFTGDTRHKTLMQWDPVCGVERLATDENNQVTRSQYDALCRVTRVDFPGDDFEITAYNHYGDPQTQFTEVVTPGADGQPDLWRREFLDGFERVYQSQKPAGDGAVLQHLTRFNQRGLVAANSDWHRATTTPRWSLSYHDGLDRLIQTTEADGRITRWDYLHGPYFEKVVRTNHQQKRSVAHYDAYRQRVQSDRFLNDRSVSTRMSFDALGRIVGIVDNVGNTWTYDFDSLGRQTRIDDPDLGIRSYEYDDVGRQLASTDALGQRTRYEYDLLGRKRRETYRAGTPDAEINEYIYDEAYGGYFNVGRLSTARNENMTVGYNYDAAGRAVQSTHHIDGNTYAFDTGFDAAGRIRWQRYPDGDLIGSDTQPWRYDAAGRLQGIPGLIESISYNDHGMMVQKVLANGVTTDYGYNDDNDWLMSINSRAGGRSIQAIVHERDSIGLITTITSGFANESWAYVYDDLYRLKSAANIDDTMLSQTFDYDTVDNMIFNSRVGVYDYPAPGSDRPHAVLSAGAHSDYRYDANGNMVAGSGREIEYDGRDRPLRIDSSTFLYGPNGERVKKTENGVTTLYVNNLEIRDGEITKYLPEDTKREAGQTFWLHKDHLQSVQAVTDSNGDMIQRYTYAAFGEQLSQSSEHIETHSFIGERLDDSGLMFLNARYYDPVLARLVVADPSNSQTDSDELSRYLDNADSQVYAKGPGEVADGLGEDSTDGDTPSSNVDSESQREVESENSGICVDGL